MVMKSVQARSGLKARSPLNLLLTQVKFTLIPFTPVQSFSYSQIMQENEGSAHVWVLTRSIEVAKCGHKASLQID